jgi:uncharacterized protein
MDYRNQSPFWSAAQSDAVSRDEGLRSYMLGVYNYMASALALTGIMAYAGANVPVLMNALYRFDGTHMSLSGLGWLVAFAPLAFVFGIGMGINRLSVGAAQGLFWGFAAVMGLSLSSLFFVYTGQSLVRVFFITAILFGSMSMWGYTTKRDLTSMGHFLIMGVWGILIASIVNIFLQSSALQFAVSVVGVVAFTGLTAYDTQKIKGMYYQTMGDATSAAKSSILGALNLYLDFINLFVMLLRFFGERK